VSDQQWLTELLPEQHKSILELSHSKIVELLAIYYLEIHRAESGIIQRCLDYVQNIPPDYPSYAFLLDCFRGIASKVDFVSLFLKAH
jgi:hypothetical protein